MKSRSTRSPNNDSCQPGSTDAAPRLRSVKSTRREVSTSSSEAPRSRPSRIVRIGADGHCISSEMSVPVAGTPVNDGPILVFDANADGVNDLLLTRGGASQPAGSSEFQPVLLISDGKGGFNRAAEDALPSLLMSVGAVTAADFNHDGALDLFIGGRVSPGDYPSPAVSGLLVNRRGKFEDVTATVIPALQNIGMVTAALWSDVDGDTWPDLLLTLEWGNVKYFHNSGGAGFEDWTEKAGFAAAGTGWWTSIITSDFNGDGRPDYVVGNVGLNTPYRADAAHPTLLLRGDFKGDGTSLLIEGYYEDDTLYPRRTRRDLGAALPAVLKRFPRNDTYARATLGEILGEKPLAAAERFTATELRSGVFLSRDNAQYEFIPLPRIAQIAPLQGMVAGDFDGDGKVDLYAVQNSYAPNPVVGRFDGGLSQFCVETAVATLNRCPRRSPGWLFQATQRLWSRSISMTTDGQTFSSREITTRRWRSVTSP